MAAGAAPEQPSPIFRRSPPLESRLAGRKWQVTRRCRRERKLRWTVYCGEASGGLSPVGSGPPRRGGKNGGHSAGRYLPAKSGWVLSP